MKFPLLDIATTVHYARKTLMPEGAITLFEEIVNSINKDNKLLTIYETFYDEYLNSGYWTTVWEQLNIDPYVEEKFGQHASLFYLHAALQRLPLAEQKYKELGISDEIFVDTMRDISTWVTNAYNLVGYYCIRNFSWVWRHIEVRMFRIGRMQYLPLTFNGDVKAFYNETDKQLVLLAKEGMELRANGDMQGVCSKPKTEDGFVTTYEETDEAYIGHPITPEGKGMPETITLNKRKWTKILDQGDTMLDIHIPKDQPFTLEAVAQSYAEAKKFLNKHLPEVKFKGMMCQSWLFTPQLKDMLSETSNVVKFQKQFYLYPTAGSVRSTWHFVFNELLEVKDAKPETSLQRKVLEYIEADKEIFDMRALFFDIYGEFGKTIYTPLDQLILK